MFRITEHAVKRAEERLGYYPWKEDSMFIHRLKSSEVIAKQKGRFIVAERNSKTICVLNRNKNALITLYSLESSKKKRTGIPAQVFLQLNRINPIVASTVVSMLPKNGRTNTQEKIHNAVKNARTVGKTELHIIAKNEDLGIAFQICRCTYEIKRAYKADSKRYIADLVKIHEHTFLKRKNALEESVEVEVFGEYSIIKYPKDIIESSEKFLFDFFGEPDGDNTTENNILTHKEKEEFFNHFSHLQKQMDSLNTFLNNVAPESAEKNMEHLEALEQLIAKVLN